MHSYIIVKLDGRHGGGGGGGWWWCCCLQKVEGRKFRIYLWGGQPRFCRKWGGSTQVWGGGQVTYVLSNRWFTNHRLEAVGESDRHSESALSADAPNATTKQQSTRKYAN